MVSQGALADSEEQTELRDSVRRLLKDKAPLSAVRDGADTGAGFDRDVWAKLVELGVTALPVPEKYEGFGQSALETHVVLEEMGRALYFGPYLATVGLAIPALLLSDDESACADLLPAIASGEKIATVAVSESDGRWDGPVTTEATEDGGGWQLTGTKEFVLDGADADLLLVTARHGDEVSLFAVDGSADGVSTTRLESLDLARAVARVALDGVKARLVGTAGAAPELVSNLLDRVLVALSAEQAGGAWACLDLCVEYAKERKQFGQPIGSFQAVAHKCVDILQSVEFSRASSRYAAAALAEDDAEFSVAARVAAAYCGESFRTVTVETVQVHGGTGFTWEHDTQLYYRRAWSAQHLFTGLDSHYLAIADRVGL